MKVRITRVRVKTYWYAHKIGEIFEVAEDAEKPDDYFVPNYGSVGHWIDKSDCEIVEDEVFTKADVPERFETINGVVFKRLHTRITYEVVGLPSASHPTRLGELWTMTVPEFERPPESEQGYWVSANNTQRMKGYYIDNNMIDKFDFIPCPKPEGTKHIESKEV